MLEIYRHAYGDEHPEVADALNSLGVTLMRLEEYQEAEAMLLESLTIRQASLGDDSEPAAAARENLGQLYMRMERFEEAKQMFQPAYLFLSENLGETYRATTRVVLALSHVLHQQGHYAQAEEMLIRMVDALRVEDGKRLGVAVGEERLALIYMDTDRLVEAETLLLRSYAALEDMRGAAHFDTVRAATELVKLYALLDDQVEVAAWMAKLPDADTNP